MQSCTHLARPIRIGTMTVRNRLVMSAMTTNYGSADFEVTERLVRYHEARARGGVGLITVEMCSVDVAQRYQPQSLSLGDDRFIAGHRELVRRVHAHGARIQPQISHPGPESMTDPVGPSVNVNAGTGWPSRVLDAEEIERIVAQYGDAAVRAREAGYDGMELHAAHGYMLLGSFLCPVRNRREDEYSGATVEGRTRLLVRVIRHIKQRAGADFPITLRISGNEDAFDGRMLNDTQLIAPLLAQAGIDAFQVSGGVSHDKIVAQIVCGSHYRDGYNVAVAAAVRKVVDVPVMVVGRIHDPAFAERIIADGDADMVAMARPLLADPELPAKALGGRAREIRRCLSCQNCIDSMLIAPFDANMNCAVNAQSGREAEREIRPANARKRVLVVGGGPAGMEAARVAALRGHEVRLVERGGRLGIRVRDSVSPTRTGFTGLHYFPDRADWSVDARFEPYEPVRKIPIVNILGMEIEMDSPGALVFDKDGKSWRLDAVLEEPGDQQLFVMFADATSGRETYGAGRFLYTPLPRDGHVRVDFNRAYNMPCAYTMFATCGLPPADNRLPISIEAGEQKYKDDH